MSFFIVVDTVTLNRATSRWKKERIGENVVFGQVIAATQMSWAEEKRITEPWKSSTGQKTPWLGPMQFLPSKTCRRSAVFVVVVAAAATTATACWWLHFRIGIGFFLGTIRRTYNPWMKIQNRLLMRVWWKKRSRYSNPSDISNYTTQPVAKTYFHPKIRNWLYTHRKEHGRLGGWVKIDLLHKTHDEWAKIGGRKVGCGYIAGIAIDSRSTWDYSTISGHLFSCRLPHGQNQVKGYWRAARTRWWKS